MTGGLMQIVSYGNQDIMLTGNPEITFFKYIYRRYTNFGKTYVNVPFDNEINFNSVVSVNIPKTGDLLAKTILHIKTPSFNLKFLNDYISKNVDITSYINNEKEIYYKYYDFFIVFKDKLSNVINNFFLNYDDTSITFVNDLDNFIKKYINNDEFFQYFAIIDFIFNNFISSEINKKINFNLSYFKNASLYKILNLNLTFIYSNFNDINFILFKNAIYANLDILNELNNIFYNIITNLTLNINNISMAWINQLAIFLFDSFELSIGSQSYNLFSADYVNINSELYNANRRLFNNVIGNNINLTNPETSKSSFDIYLNIPFWFYKNYGLAVPLIALQYNDINIKIKIKKLIDCVHFSQPKSFNKFITNEILAKITDIFLSNINEIFTSKLEINLICEYIYLDSAERKKFAQSSHEYLITQIQEIDFKNTSTINNNFDLDFFHCSKELYWFSKQNKYINNIIGNNLYSKYDIDYSNKNYTINNNIYIDYLNIIYNPFVKFDYFKFISGLLFFNNYIYNNFTNYNNDVNLLLTKTYNKLSPISHSSIILNGVNLTDFDNNFYNFLHPYLYYNSIPSFGINIYSFSLNPTEIQPSGSCNFSRIPKLNIKLNIYNTNNSDNLYNLNDYSLNLDSYNNLNIIDKNIDNLNSNLNDFYTKFICVNYNVIRIVGGIAGLAFT
jgi:hypothetical protein